MKKYIFIAIALLGAFSSCSFEDEEVTYPYTSILFPNQDYNRNVVVGEGLELQVGVIFSGVVNNKMDRSVTYAIDPSLITGAGKSALPVSYFLCADTSKIVVPKGELKGYLTIKLDSAAFLSDPKSLTGEYILPIKLVSSSDVDSINQAKNYMNISVSYFAKQHGNYTYQGTTVKNNAGVLTEVTYTNDPTVTTSIRFLKTVGPNRLQVVADPTGTRDPEKGVYSFIIEVATSGSGAVTILPDPASAVSVTPVGESTYDAATKTFKLNYTYTVGGVVCTASDELVFRNRIRDVQSNGLYINEWRGF